MNHKTKVNTSPQIQQAKNATLALLQLNTMRQHLGDVEGLVYTAQTLSEIAFEQIDLISSLTSGDAVNTAVMRLDALTRSICRSVLVIQEATEAAYLVLEEVEGGAQ